MTREEAIKALKLINLSSVHPFLHWEEMMEVRDMAISALRAQQQAEDNDPLTLDELREMDGDKIYIRYIGACKGFYKDGFAPFFGRHGAAVHEYDGKLHYCNLPLARHGKDWLAYRRKPEAPRL